MRRFDSFRSLEFIAMIEAMPLKLLQIGKRELIAGAAVLPLAAAGLTMLPYKEMLSIAKKLLLL